MREEGAVAQHRVIKPATDRADGAKHPYAQSRIRPPGDVTRAYEPLDLTLGDPSVEIPGRPMHGG